MRTFKNTPLSYFRDFDARHEYSWTYKLNDFEYFFEQVLSVEGPAYWIEDNPKTDKNELKENPALSKFFFEIHRKFQVQFEFLNANFFTEYFELFSRCFSESKLSDEFFTNPRHASRQKGKKQYEVFNDFISSIRAVAKIDPFRRMLGKRQDRIDKRKKSAIKYIKTMLDNCSCLFAVRLTLAYKLEADITVEAAINDFLRFKNNWRGKPALFHDLEGFLWKIVWDEPMLGFHFHLVLFFNGTETLKKEDIGNQIGLYWIACSTNKLGAYALRDQSINSGRFKSERLDVGAISGSSTEQREYIFKHTVNYLCGIEPRFKSIQLGSIKFFGHGEHAN
ncbi:hypothetical protein GALL_62290 [mine drainage metagenome]|uniref:Inovirus Gp2 family protein n=1 Tax=mine drainage metagenome TaxID=410659 RepID=A0A1J5SVG6_9ZZZZ